MIRHSVAVMTTTGGFVPRAAHRAVCSTCGWRGDLFAEHGKADDQARNHHTTARPVVFDSPNQATTDSEGEAAERRHLRARPTSPVGADTAALAEARRRIDAALGDPEHQRALDAEIDRRLADHRRSAAGDG